MSVQLNISVDNKIQTLTSGVGGDILDTFLAGSNAATTRHIKVDMTRNCCSSGTITYYYAPRYAFTLTNLQDDTYTPGGLTANDRVATFMLNGIDVSYIKKFEVVTNEDAPTTATYVFKEYTALEATTTGFKMFYLENGTTSVYQMRITTIDDYVYLIDVTYDWADTPPPTATTTTTTIVSYPSIVTVGTEDFIGEDIEFTPLDWGLSVTDDIFLDGVYQYNLTQVEVGSDVVETVSKFFNIRLRCLVTTYIASNLKDTEIGLVMEALEMADACGLSVAYKCALYGRVIRKLLLSNQIKATGSLGCNCGCS